MLTNPRNKEVEFEKEYLVEKNQETLKKIYGVDYFLVKIKLHIINIKDISLF